MTANLFNLVNVEPLVLNTTGLNDTSTIVTTMFTKTTNTIGDIWFYFSIWGLFIFFIWLFYKPSESFRYDVSRTFLLSSGFCFFISVSVLLGGWINTVYPIVWFSTISFISFIAVWIMKKKGT